MFAEHFYMKKKISHLYRLLPEKIQRCCADTFNIKNSYQMFR